MIYIHSFIHHWCYKILADKSITNTLTKKKDATGETDVPRVQFKAIFYGVDNVAAVNSVPDNVTAEVSVMKGYCDVSLFQILHTYSAGQNVEVLDLQSR